jgi:hypothetical protein
MKINKKIAVFSLFLMLFSATSTLANPIVVLSENGDDYTQTETGYILNFELLATSSELQSIEDRVSSMDAVTMQVQLVEEGKYTIVYTIDHQNQPEYVHKMMLSSGFQTIKYQGQDHPLEKVIDVLYSFQDQH